MSPIFEGSIAEVRDHLAGLLLERTSRDHCVIDSVNDYDFEVLRSQAIEATEDAGPDPQLIEGGYFLGERDAAVAAFGGTDLLATSGSSAWYLTTPDTVEMPGIDEGVVLVAVSLIELESADGRPVWWRSEDYIAVEPDCTPLE